MPTCDKCGEQFDRPTFEFSGVQFGAEMTPYCGDCGPEMWEEEQADGDDGATVDERYEAALDGANIPRRQRLQPVEPDEVVCQFVDRDWPRPDCALYLYGKTRTGKTSQAIAGLMRRARQCAEQGDVIEPQFVEMAELVRRLKPYGDGLEVYASADLLVLDELGREKHTDKTAEYVDAIIRERHKACLPTILTSNAPIKPMEAYSGSLAGHRSYDDRVIRRLVDMTDAGEWIHEFEEKRQ